MTDNVNISLQNDIVHILDRLEASGFEAYTVGGFVRDALLSRDAGDCDITTDATPEEIKRVFSDYRTIDTGIKHGTVTLIYNGKTYEITTYRVDGEYADNRHPDRVEFTTSLHADLARRDFTVNAMAYSSRRGLVDLFDGRGDIEAGVIRAVGNPTRRFEEDALRILRAVRFASVLDFSVEEATRAAIFRERGRLSSISAERIFSELKKLFGGVGAYRVITEFPQVISEQLCGVSEIRLPSEEVFSHLSAEERLISVFYLSAASPEEAFSETMRRLKSDRQTERRGRAVLSVMTDEPTGDRLLLTVLDKGIDLVNFALTLLLRIKPETERLYLPLAEFISSSKPSRLSELKIDGRDINALGISGSAVGELLSYIMLAVMRGEVENDRDELIRFIKKHPTCID